MLRLLERNIRCVEQRLVLLAPAHVEVPSTFHNVDPSQDEHQRLLREAQAMRGQVYLKDGALTREQLTNDGRHCTPEDEASWHLLMLNRERQVTACAWYLDHRQAEASENFRVWKSPLATLTGWRDALCTAVYAELDRARQAGLHFSELGGWAVTEDTRTGCDALMLALASFSLSQTLGGGLGITTATVRHASSTILRRLGGRDLEADGQQIPKYYDPHYNCDMELLRFDSRQPGTKYSGLVDKVRARFPNVQVIGGRPADDTQPLSWLPSSEHLFGLRPALAMASASV